VALLITLRNPLLTGPLVIQHTIPLIFLHVNRHPAQRDLRLMLLVSIQRNIHQEVQLITRPQHLQLDPPMRQVTHPLDIQRALQQLRQLRNLHMIQRQTQQVLQRMYQLQIQRLVRLHTQLFHHHGDQLTTLQKFPVNILPFHRHEDQLTTQPQTLQVRQPMSQPLLQPRTQRNYLREVPPIIQLMAQRQHRLRLSLLSRPLSILDVNTTKTVTVDTLCAYQMDIAALVRISVRAMCAAMIIPVFVQILQLNFQRHYPQLIQLGILKLLRKSQQKIQMNRQWHQLWNQPQHRPGLPLQDLLWPQRPLHQKNQLSHPRVVLLITLQNLQLRIPRGLPAEDHLITQRKHPQLILQGTQHTPQRRTQLGIQQ